MTFIDTINDKTNIDIVVSDAKGDQEARDDLRIGLGSVQKRDHVEAGIAGSGDKPPTSAPRDNTQALPTLDGRSIHCLTTPSTRCLTGYLWPLAPCTASLCRGTDWWSGASWGEGLATS